MKTFQQFVNELNQGEIDEISPENIDELFITRKTPEEREREKKIQKVQTLIRLMKHAKDPTSDVARVRRQSSN